MGTQSGIALIEAMVAVLMLGIGVLGATGLAWRAHQAAAEAALLGRATELATAVAEMLDAGGPASPLASLDYEASAPPDAADAAVQAVQTRVHTGFPGGRILICRDSHPWRGDAIAWACSGNGPRVVKLGWRTRGRVRAVEPQLAMPVAGGAP